MVADIVAEVALQSSIYPVTVAAQVEEKLVESEVSEAAIVGESLATLTSNEIDPVSISPDERMLKARGVRLQADLALEDATLRREQAEAIASQAALARCEAEDCSRLVQEARLQAERKLQSTALARIEVEQYAESQLQAKLALELEVTRQTQLRGATEDRAIEAARIRLEEEQRAASLAAKRIEHEEAAKEAAQARNIAEQEAVATLVEHAHLQRRAVETATLKAEQAVMLAEAERQHAVAEEMALRALQEKVGCERVARDAALARQHADTRQALVLQSKAQVDESARLAAEAEANALQLALENSSREAVLAGQRVAAAEARAIDAETLAKTEQERAEMEQAAWQAIQARLAIEQENRETAQNSLQLAESQLTVQEATQREIKAKEAALQRELDQLREVEKSEEALRLAREAAAIIAMNAANDALQRLAVQQESEQIVLNLARETAILAEIERERVAAEQQALSAVLEKLRREQTVCAAAQARAEADEQYNRILAERESVVAAEHAAIEERSHAEQHRNDQHRQQTERHEHATAVAAETALAAAEKHAIAIAATEVAEDRRMTAETIAMKAMQEKQKVALQREQTNLSVAQALAEKTVIEQEQLSMVEAELEALRACQEHIRQAAESRRQYLILAQQRQASAASLASAEQHRLEVEVENISAQRSAVARLNHDKALDAAEKLIERLTRNGIDSEEWRARAQAILAESGGEIALSSNSPSTTPSITSGLGNSPVTSYAVKPLPISAKIGGAIAAIAFTGAAVSGIPVHQKIAAVANVALQMATLSSSAQAGIRK